MNSWQQPHNELHSSGRCAAASLGLPRLKSRGAVIVRGNNELRSDLRIPLQSRAAAMAAGRRIG